MEIDYSRVGLGKWHAVSGYFDFFCLVLNVIKFHVLIITGYKGSSSSRHCGSVISSGCSFLILLDYH